jgi:putative transposase
MSGRMARRTRRSRDEWQRLVSEQAESDLTQTAFCEANGLSVASLQYWKRKLADRSEAIPSAPWVDLGTLAAAGSPGWDIELQLGDGICLRLRRC